MNETDTSDLTTDAVPSCSVFFSERPCSELNSEWMLFMDICVLINLPVTLFFLTKLIPVLRKSGKTSYCGVSLTIPRSLSIAVVILQLCVASYDFLVPMRRYKGNEGASLFSAAEDARFYDTMHLVMWWTGGCAYAYFGIVFVLYYLQVLELSVMKKKRQDRDFGDSPKSEKSTTRNRIVLSLSKKSVGIVNRVRFIIAVTFVFTLSTGIYGMQAKGLTYEERDIVIGVANTLLVLLFCGISGFSWYAGLPRINALGKPRVAKQWKWNQFISSLLPLVVLTTDVAAVSPAAWAFWRGMCNLLWTSQCSWTIYLLLRRNIRQLKSNKVGVVRKQSRREIMNSQDIQSYISVVEEEELEEGENAISGINDDSSNDEERDTDQSSDTIRDRDDSLKKIAQNY